MPDSVRVDKWLWAVRLYKTRTQATTACKSGKIKTDKQILKPSSLVSVSDEIEVRKMGFNFRFRIEKIIAKRVGAPLARPCYTDITSEEELNKYRDWFKGKAPAEYRGKGMGRPTKNERRALDSFKENYYENLGDLDD